MGNVQAVIKPKGHVSQYSYHTVIRFVFEGGDLALFITYTVPLALQRSNLGTLPKGYLPELEGSRP